MSEQLRSLEGVSILVPPLDYSRMSDQLALFLGGEEASKLQEATREMVETAAHLGAKIIKDENGDPHFYRAHLSDPNIYALEGSAVLVTEAINNLAHSPESQVKQPGRMPYREYKKMHSLDLPIVLASVLDGGESKYLIEQQEQLDKFDALNQYFSDQPIDGMFEAREFIPTPSSHFTSYRILTAATGEIIAAGLLYSDHTKQDKKIIEISPETPWDTLGSSKCAGLEIPGNPFFLNSQDIRSNIQQGGHCIPLLGGHAARPLTAHEEDILSEHGIAPYDIKVPAELVKQVHFISRVLGKYFGLAVGLDFLQHKESGEFYFLEANAGPGGQTFLECWFRGDHTPNAADTKRALLARCFASMAVQRALHSSEPL